MFGDWGHALLMLSFALFCILREKQFLRSNMGEVLFFRLLYVDFLVGVLVQLLLFLLFALFGLFIIIIILVVIIQIFAMLFRGRYVILAMSLASIYTGLMYNDFFSLSFNLFGSAYPDGIENQPWPSNYVVPFGIDPVWYGTDNKVCASFRGCPSECILVYFRVQFMYEQYLSLLFFFL